MTLLGAIMTFIYLRFSIMMSSSLNVELKGANITDREETFFNPEF